MKTIIMASILTLFSMSSSFACSCEKQRFTKEDIKSAVNDFLVEKLDGRPHEFEMSGALKKRKYRTMAQSSLLFGYLATSIFKDKYIRECEEDCSYSINSDADYKITFYTKDQVCEVDLQVIMSADVFSDGFTSEVIQKRRPICN